MDAPDDAIDFLELSVAAALRSRSVPVVGELRVVWPASALATVPSTAESAAVAGTWAGPAGLMLCALGEAIHLAAVLE